MYIYIYLVYPRSLTPPADIATFYPDAKVAHALKKSIDSRSPGASQRATTEIHMVYAMLCCVCVYVCVCAAATVYVYQNTTTKKVRTMLHKLYFMPAVVGCSSIRQ